MAELDTYLRFFFALIFVLGLIGGSAWFLKRFLLERGAHRNAKGPGRLEIVETKMIDARRKLILLRRDSVEHLLILGPNQETVIVLQAENQLALDTDRATQGPGDALSNSNRRPRPARKAHDRANRPGAARRPCRRSVPF